MHKSCTFDFWHDDTTGASIHDQVFYSTNFYTTRAIEILANHTEHAPPDQSPAAAMVAGQLHAGAFRYQSATDHLPVTELSGRFAFVPGSMRQPSGEVFEIAVGPVPCEPPAYLY